MYDIKKGRKELKINKKKKAHGMKNEEEEKNLYNFKNKFFIQCFPVLCSEFVLLFLFISFHLLFLACF